jgi:flagellin-specific chaperone FliS
MYKEQTLKENISWLLERYKQELEHAKKEDTNNSEYGYDKEQFITDAENIIIELEYALKISRKD